MPSALRPKTPRRMASLRDPFLLPVCDCGGPVILASLEPHPTLPDHERKTFKCTRCGTQQVFDVRKREIAKTD